MDAATEVESLRQELASLRQLTMAVMTSNGDMGVVVQFLKNSFAIPSYQALGEALIESLGQLGLKGAVTLETYTGRIFIGPEGSLDIGAASAIKADLLTGRIVERDGVLQINYDSASLRVTELPDNEERIGQLRDSLALLMEGAEARVKSLIMEEKAIEARQSKDEFFALMSNELRTPLNPIIGYATRLEKKLGSELDEQYRTVIRSIKSNGESLLRLVNHIIDLGKLEAGEIAVNRRPFNVSDAITYSIIKAEEFIDRDKTNIVKHVDPNLFFVADPPRIIDIIISLLAYSAQASDNHIITITASLEKADDTDNLIVEVQDDSQAFSEAYKTKVFERFANRENVDMYESNDLGIGLYLTKKLVELHGGNTTLHNKMEKGNVFRMSLPSF
ncbi:HAMP domain-containing histidine kinase [Saccharophagus degradans]|uniref:sensor histidine kinase n=1 Tax=Saccharophagus degradans TaxID=86304 RepID=UPI001C085C6E|nr:HAMP domain-containing sensor histidine kinase [Saccharophagus degradans]MBU2985414.1 HAMP domain-containing histidine kinase [Saccharophagus degradans]